MFGLNQLKKTILSSPVGMRKRSSLIQMVSSYGLQAVGMVQGFLLIPIYIQYIGAEQFGFWLATGGILVALMTFDLGLSQPINQKISRHTGKKEREEAANWFWTGLACYFAILLIAALPAFWIAVELPVFLSIPSSYRPDFELAILVAYFATLLKILGDYIQGYAAAVLRPTGPSIGLILGQILGIGLNIALITSGYGVVAIAVGLIAAQIFALFCGFIFIAHSLTRKKLLLRGPSWRVVAHIRSFIAHTIFVKVFQRFTQQAEPLVLTMFIGAETAALYGINKKVADLLDRLVSVIWGSTFYSVANLAGAKSHDELKRITNLLLKVLLGSITVLVAGYIAYNTRFVSWWVSSDMTMPLVIVALVGMSRISEIAANFLSEMHIALGRIKFTAQNLLVFIALRFALLCLGVWWLGIVGAPSAVLLSTILAAVFFFFKLRSNEDLLTFPSQNIAGFLSVVMGFVFTGMLAAYWLSPLQSEVGAVSLTAIMVSMLGIIWVYLFFKPRSMTASKQDRPDA